MKYFEKDIRCGATIFLWFATWDISVHSVLFQCSYRPDISHVRYIGLIDNWSYFHMSKKKYIIFLNKLMSVVVWSEPWEGWDKEECTLKRWKNRHRISWFFVVRQQPWTFSFLQLEMWHLMEYDSHIHLSLGNTRMNENRKMNMSLVVIGINLMKLVSCISWLFEL